MATSTIYPFAPTDTGSNLLTTAEYEADPQRLIGHQPGVARSKLENKALKQSSVMAAALAKFIATRGVDVSDEQTHEAIGVAIDGVVTGIAQAISNNTTGSALSDFVNTRLTETYILMRGNTVWYAGAHYLTTPNVSPYVWGRITPPVQMRAVNCCVVTPNIGVSDNYPIVGNAYYDSSANEIVVEIIAADRRPLGPGTFYYSLFLTGATQ